MKRLLFMLLIPLVLLSGCAKSYESPIKYSATYEVITQGFWGDGIFTDNYTITNDFVILHGYSNERLDRNSSGDLLIPRNDIKAIQANPYLGKGK